MLKKVINTIKKNKNKILIALSFAAGAYLFYRSYNDDSSIKLSSFIDALSNNQLEEIVIKGNTLYFRSALSDWYHTSFEGLSKQALFSQIKNTKIEFSFEEENQFIYHLVPVALTLLSFYVSYKFFFNQMGTPTKNASIYPKIERFDHYYGGERMKAILQQIIQKMINPQKFSHMNLRNRRGILLYGPSGTGKTMIARILASEANLPFIHTTASEFEEIFVGVGPKKIRQIFNQGRKFEKGCIIFIDELDALGSRTQNWQTKEQRSTINQLLSEIDGFDQNHNIFVIGATNNIQLVDKALLRPGRFDIKVMVPLPDHEERKGIFSTIIKRKSIPHEIEEKELSEIGHKTGGWSGADLQNLINESGYLAVRKNKDKIGMEEISTCLEELAHKLDD